MKGKSENGVMTVEVYGAAAQGSGAFDGGKITEIKPIPFPGEAGGSRQLGPLFYWAWASAKGDGVIGMHPHRGYEIMSYVLEGEVGHTDSAGNNRRVGTGGAQVMQTGSGISHEEEMYGERTEFFQIWFEPDLSKALKAAPVYADFEESDFPVTRVEGAEVKAVVGNGGPVEIEAPVEVEDVTIAPGADYAVALEGGAVLAAMVIEGGGRLEPGEEDVGRAVGRSVGRRDFVVVKVKAGRAGEVKIAAGNAGMRLLLVRARERGRVKGEE